MEKADASVAGDTEQQNLRLEPRLQGGTELGGVGARGWGSWTLCYALRPGFHSLLSWLPTAPPAFRFTH